MSIIDLRTVSFDVPKQEVLTKDSVTVDVDAVVYYKVVSPMEAICSVENYAKSTKLLAATTLRTVIGTKNLSEILSEREAIARDISEHLDHLTDCWGIHVKTDLTISPYIFDNFALIFQVERVEVKDCVLPKSLQRAMAAEAEATREARAKVIAAEGENKASKSLKEASDVISESPCALQLRYLQTLTHISAEKNSTIIFPLPMDLIGNLMNVQKAKMD